MMDGFGDKERKEVERERETEGDGERGTLKGGPGR